MSRTERLAKGNSVRLERYVQRGFKTWSERKSAELRVALQLPIHGFLPAKVLARHLKLTVLCPSQLPGISTAVLNELLVVSPGCWSAVTIPTDAGAVISSSAPGVYKAVTTGTGGPSQFYRVKH